jgi:hypothetical protein
MEIDMRGNFKEIKEKRRVLFIGRMAERELDNIGMERYMKKLCLLM